MKMRVGFVNENLSGHAAFHSQLMRAVASTGAFEWESSDVPPRQLIRRALTNPVPLPQGWDVDAPLFRNQVGQSAVMRSAVRRMARRCDVVHFYTQNAAPLTLGELGTVPLVVTTDGSCSQTAQRHSFRYPGRGHRIGVALSEMVERRVVNRASAIITQSDWARGALLTRHRVEPSKVKTVRLGAPRVLPLHDRATADVIRLVFVGASLRRKGAYDILSSVGDLLGERLHLTLVTREPFPAHPGITVRNDVRPGDGKIWGILAESDVFLLPSDMDMTPNSVFEAMASGLPVIAYDDGALSEMVLDRRSGYLCRTHNLRDLRLAVTALADDADRRRQFGMEGRNLLKDRFDPDRAVKELIEILMICAAPRTGDPA